MSKKLISKWKSQKDNRSISKDLFNSIDKIKPRGNHHTAQKIHEEVFEEIDCLECANCCKSIPPIVSKRDSKRIAQFLGVKKKIFEKKYLKTDEDGDQVINTSPCPFLLNDNKCSIYDVRPAACRQYPHTGEDVFFKHIHLHKRNYKYCPAVFEILKRLEKCQ